jgi:hypothetical protein
MRGCWAANDNDGRDIVAMNGGWKGSGVVDGGGGR